MNNFFLTLGFSGYFPKIPAVMGAFVSLLLSLIILMNFNETTLFLATILISIIAIRAINRYEEDGGEHHAKHIVIDKFSGIGFALSVAPAVSTSLQEITHLSNGFLIQALLSFAFFIYFDKEKHSVIGRISSEAKGGIAVVGDDILAGFIAGIVSSLLWQSYLQAASFFA